MKKIFFVASEAQPFFASGGLGDAIGSLPKKIVKNAKDKFFKNTLDLKLAWGYII